MVATLFYVDALPDTGALAVVDGDEGFHAATVRRIREGEELMLGDGVGGLARCVVEQTGRDGLRARVVERWQVPSVQPPVTVVQALPKSERSELAIELATEAGADSLVAWQAARCVARWEGARADKGLRRWASPSPSTPSWTARARSPFRPARSPVRSSRCAAMGCRTCARAPGAICMSTSRWWCPPGWTTRRPNCCAS